MIVSQLNGGLGNQLFQISAAYTLARENNDTCAFDFNVPCVNQGNSPWKYRNTLYRKLNTISAGWKPLEIYKEKTYDYRPIPYKDNLLLKGYFQREAYFAKYAREIKNLFINEAFYPLYESLPYTEYLKNSLSIHVRRGDYVSKFPDIHVVQPIEYYIEAIEYVDIVEDIEHILVFSDDIAWCRENIRDSRIVYVNELDDYKCLMLMGLCDANIIANSSFSWWGSWLGEEPLKTIIAPKKWFKDNILNSSEIVPQRWCKL